MCRRLLRWALAATAICILVAGNGYAKEKDTVLPSEYPAEWDVIFQPTRGLYEPANQFSFQTYLGFYPGEPEEILTAGTSFFPDTMPLPCDIIWMHDVEVPLRDGTIIYVDIFRPASNPNNLPAVIAWAPYGKSVPADPLAHFSGSVPVEWVSGLNRFEGPDPGYWCNQGYAVINVDTRGAYMSEGDTHYWGMVDAADGYDVIEWVASQDWSNGKVGMHGTSWLAIAEWFIAATQPPHLAAIAPWNGVSDLYRQDVLWGGIPNAFFNGYITSGMTGNGNYVEAPYEMVNKYPLWHPYWEDKAAKLENITVPAYVAVQISGDLHRMGTFEGFRRISSKEKWLRAYSEGEWYDQYTPENVADLQRFFDRYLKGIDNGWEQTPRVRMTVLDIDGVEDVNRPESKWPLVPTHYRKFYLDAANGTLSPHPVTKASSVSYDGINGQTEFTITFEEDTEVTGYLKLRLCVEADGADDMDLFVLVQKLDANGNLPAGWNGDSGRLRVSLRALDPVLSTHFLPIQSFRKQEFLSPGQIVQIDIAIWPMSMLWHAGEQLRLIVAGNKLAGFAQADNSGNHIIHTGRKYQSYLQLPIIPMK